MICHVCWLLFSVLQILLHVLAALGQVRVPRNLFGTNNSSDPNPNHETRRLRNISVAKHFVKGLICPVNITMIIPRQLTTTTKDREADPFDKKV